MSDHADTIRAGILAPDREARGDVVTDALASLAALVAENQRLSQHLDRAVDGWRLSIEGRLKDVAENQRLRDALERSDRGLRGLLARTPVRDVAETLAETRAALDGTP